MRWSGHQIALHPDRAEWQKMAPGRHPISTVLGEARPKRIRALYIRL